MFRKGVDFDTFSDDIFRSDSDSDLILTRLVSEKVSGRCQKGAIYDETGEASRASPVPVLWESPLRPRHRPPAAPPWPLRACTEPPGGSFKSSAPRRLPAFGSSGPP